MTDQAPPAVPAATPPPTGSDDRVKLLARRAGAFLIDIVIALVVMQLLAWFDPLFVPFQGADTGTVIDPQKGLAIVRGFTPIGWLVTLPFLLFRDRFRVGKRITGVHAIDVKTQQPVGWGKSALRNLPFVFPMCAGFLALIELAVARIDSQGRRIMDRLAGTMTVPVRGAVSVAPDRADKMASLSVWDLVATAPLLMLFCGIPLLGILAAIAIPSNLQMHERAVRSEARATLEWVTNAQMAYMAEHNERGSVADLNREQPFPDPDWMVVDLTPTGVPDSAFVYGVAAPDKSDKTFAVVVTEDGDRRFYETEVEAAPWTSLDPGPEWSPF